MEVVGRLVYETRLQFVGYNVFRTSHIYDDINMHNGVIALLIWQAQMYNTLLISTSPFKET
jgi:hypothetical protein